MDSKAHWEKIYTNKSAKEVSWYRDRLDISLELIQRAHLSKDAKIIDVGGGASTLVDDLLRMGFEDVSVLDLSAMAIEKAKQRLGARSDRVHWLEGDVTDISIAGSHYDLWHDRAVFHFMVEAGKRAAYVANATWAVTKGGFLIVGTFAPSGPSQCSGLPVDRYGPEELARQFPAFFILEERSEQHQTPSRTLQSFTYVLLQRRDISDAGTSDPNAD
jgi:SAM-dependent methyltransferase